MPAAAVFLTCFFENQRTWGGSFNRVLTSLDEGAGVIDEFSFGRNRIRKTNRRDKMLYVGDVCNGCAR